MDTSDSSGHADGNQPGSSPTAARHRSWGHQGRARSRPTRRLSCLHRVLPSPPSASRSGRSRMRQQPPGYWASIPCVELLAMDRCCQQMRQKALTSGTEWRIFANYTTKRSTSPPPSTPTRSCAATVPAATTTSSRTMAAPSQ